MPLKHTITHISQDPNLPTVVVDDEYYKQYNS
jgi:hypothetical protein